MVVVALALLLFHVTRSLRSPSTACHLFCPVAANSAMLGRLEHLRVATTAIRSSFCIGHVETQYSSVFEFRIEDAHFK